MQTQKSGSADDELLVPAEIAKLLKVSLSWLAKARLAGPRPLQRGSRRSSRAASCAARHDTEDAGKP
jgi:hypothetical protein